MLSFVIHILRSANLFASPYPASIGRVFSVCTTQSGQLQMLKNVRIRHRDSIQKLSCLRRHFFFLLALCKAGCMELSQKYQKASREVLYAPPRLHGIHPVTKKRAKERQRKRESGCRNSRIFQTEVRGIHLFETLYITWTTCADCI